MMGKLCHVTETSSGTALLSRVKVSAPVLDRQKSFLNLQESVFV